MLKNTNGGLPVSPVTENAFVWLKTATPSDLDIIHSINVLTYFECYRWRFGAVGSDVDRINEVTLRRAQLVLGWVTVSGFNSRCG